MGRRLWVGQLQGQVERKFVYGRTHQRWHRPGGSRNQNYSHIPVLSAPVPRMSPRIQELLPPMQMQSQLTSKGTWNSCTIPCILSIIEVNGRNGITHLWHALWKVWNEIITDFSTFILIDTLKKNFTQCLVEGVNGINWHYQTLGFISWTKGQSISKNLKDLEGASSYHAEKYQDICKFKIKQTIKARMLLV